MREMAESVSISDGALQFGAGDGVTNVGCRPSAPPRNAPLQPNWNVTDCNAVALHSRFSCPCAISSRGLRFCVRHLSLAEARETQRFAAEALRALRENLTDTEGKLRVDPQSALAISRLMVCQERAWCRDRTMRGLPYAVKNKPPDHSAAGRAQRAAARRASARPAPGSVEPVVDAPPIVVVPACQPASQPSVVDSATPIVDSASASQPEPRLESIEPGGED